jgi:sarcosine oxidase subunit alpha
MSVCRSRAAGWRAAPPALAHPHGQVVSAIGAIERPLSFAGNDKPGVMLASAMRDYVTQYGVSPGDRTVVVTNNDDAYRTAIALKQAGLDVPCIVDARPKADGPLPQEARAMGIPVKTGTAIAGVKGIRGVVALQLCSQAGEGAVTEESSARPSPCPAAGRPRCISGPIAAAS